MHRESMQILRNFRSATTYVRFEAIMAIFSQYYFRLLYTGGDNLKKPAASILEADRQLSRQL